MDTFTVLADFLQRQKRKFWITIVNWTCHFLNGGSFEMTSLKPFKYAKLQAGVIHGADSYMGRT